MRRDELIEKLVERPRIDAGRSDARLATIERRERHRRAASRSGTPIAERRRARRRSPADVDADGGRGRGRTRSTSADAAASSGPTTSEGRRGGRRRRDPRCQRRARGDPPALRLPALTGHEQADGDVYVSAAQVRRCELRPGDEVAGPAREPRRGERHPALVHVDRSTARSRRPVASGRPEFDDAGGRSARPADRDPRGRRAARPGRRPARAARLGQRVLVRSAPRSGRTTLLRALAGAIGNRRRKPRSSSCCVDERPEELRAWREALPEADIVAATADLAPAEQVQGRRARARARAPPAEAGADASCCRLAQSPRGRRRRRRRGQAPVRLRPRARGRDTGSLTVIATVFDGGDDEGSAERAVMTTESSLIVLDPELAAQGVVPAIKRGRVPGQRRGQDCSRADELDALRALRGELAGLSIGATPRRCCATVSARARPPSARIARGAARGR